MANTLTGIIPTLYEALNIVSRELVGFIPAVKRDSNAERAGLNQTVRSPIGVAGAVEDIVPGVNPADSGDTTVGFEDVVITKSRAAPIRWTGEEQRSVGTTGVINNILLDQFTDGMRKLVNEIEADLADEAYKAASRAVGTAGTTPFGTANDLSDMASVNQVLDENGAPRAGRQLVLGSAAMANLRGKQSVLFKVNEAGSADMLRDGMTDRVQGFALRDSAGLGTHTKGTGASYVTSGASAIAARQIALITGTGTVLAGDVVTFAGNTDKHVVNAGISAPGTITIGKPGLRAAVADAVAMTIGDSYAPNVGFHEGAIILAARAPALPDGGDDADDRTTIVDPFSGLTFEVSIYRQYRQVKYEIALAWGVKTVNGAHVATLMG